MTAIIHHMPLGYNYQRDFHNTNENHLRSDGSSSRLLRWKRQCEAQKLLPDERIADCKWKVKGTGVDIMITPKGSTYYKGLFTCGQVWVCPVCAAKIATKRRDELNQGIAQHIGNGGVIMMETYTVSHTKQEKLSEVMRSLDASMKRMQQGRAAQANKKLFNILGTVTVREVTYGENGWHYHIHRLVFFNQQIDTPIYENVMRRRWEEATKREGGQVNEHGYRLNRTYGHIASYVTKFGVETQETWGIADEMTGAHAKQGRNAKGITPFEMLDLIDKGQTRYIALFKEYARWIKGKRQLVWSKSLRQSLSLVAEEMTDLEIASQEDAESTRILHLNVKEWSFICENNLRCELLEIARQGKRELIEEFLWDIGIGRLHLLHVA